MDPTGRLKAARVALASFLCAGLSLAGAPTAAEPPLLAHWTFDEADGAPAILDASGGGGAIQRRAPRIRGVHGSALHLEGRHRLQTRAVAQSAKMAAISFAAWTRPRDLSSFREIFRQECPQRLLFSFQEGGTILSLGLNVNGYVECDARIEPSQVLDGLWHHCAATFDGKFMRVYLDGREIGSRRRPGPIRCRLDVPCFVGSSSGSGEHFQGDLDDLRIYAGALTPKEVSRLHEQGRRSLEHLAREVKRKLDALYVAEDSFARTLAALRRNTAEKKVSLDPDLAAAAVARLKSSFPEDYASFVRSSPQSPVDLLASNRSDLVIAEVARLMELATEYKPLTQDQWRRQTPRQLRQWKAVEALEQRYERLRQSAAASSFSPEWIELLLETGRRVHLRPSAFEAVAPHVKPATPPVRDLSPAEARAVLRRDWLHQIDGKPEPDRIRSEIRWALRLADRIESRFPERVDFSAERRRLEALRERAESLSGADEELYFEVRRVKRAIQFENPVVDFDKVVFVDMPYPRGSEWRHETRHRLGYMAVPGARLLVLEHLGPEGKLTQLMPRLPLHGSFWRPDLSFDARRVLFCFKPHNEKSFHIYEIGVDGSGLVQLTDGPYDDLDPIYLPDGRHILFSTTRGNTYVRCMPPTNAYVLARADRGGKNIYLISRNNEPDYLPSMLDDGRIIYTRWEYTDKPLWRAQGLWTVHPDGTQVTTFWGNQSVWPDLLKDARCIPGTRRVMFTGSAHHDWFSGSVGILDPAGGVNFPGGIRKVTADVPWPESGNGPVDPIEAEDYHRSGTYPAYYSPYPLGEEDFLVSASRNGKFLLYLMDVHGNRELVYEGAANIFHAMPLRPRARPPVLPDRVSWPDRKSRDRPEDGILFSANVYEGAPAELRGKARYLRVLHIQPKTYTYWYKRPYISTGPVVSMVQSEGVKCILGTVPVEEDGSVAFRVPSGKALHFQLLDENYRALQTMRSFTGVMPGERRGCLGCHELHSSTPRYEGRALALPARIREITPPPWGESTVSYPRFVQPVLDRYCGECHQGGGEARGTLDLTVRPGFRMFNEPYVTLTGSPAWGKPYAPPRKPPPGWGIANVIMVEGYDTRDPKAYATPAPMTRLSYNSKLVDIASSGKHHGVKVDPTSLRKLIAWIDAMCPYRGEEEVRAIPDPEFQGVDWLSVRPRIRSAPRIVRPGPVD